MDHSITNMPILSAALATVGLTISYVRRKEGARVVSDVRCTLYAGPWSGTKKLWSNGNVETASGS